jgi:hypothetical protein
VINSADDNDKVDGHENQTENEKTTVTLPGVVEKIIKPLDNSDPEKAQIMVLGADDLYEKIRIENTLRDGAGDKVKLKPGATVEVTIEAPIDAVEKKKTA